MAKKTRKTRAGAASAKPEAVEKPAVDPGAAGPALRWFVCEDGGVHVFGPCPRCFETSGGMLLGSTLPECKGIARARCSECGETIDYFVDQQHEQVWKAEAIREPAGSAPR